VTHSRPVGLVQNIFLVTQADYRRSPLAALQITFKSLKPPYSITIPVSPADSISSIKGQISTQPNAPPADAQRLLLKGKALADAKLLQEYNVQDGGTINLMVKPGVDWDPTKPQEPPALLSVETSSLTAAATAKKRGHSRIPSVVLSTPSSPLEKPQDIQLVDADGFTFSAEIGTEPTVPQTTYRTTVSQPEYWEKLLVFLRFVDPCAMCHCISLNLTPPSSPGRNFLPTRTHQLPLKSISRLARAC
jgi:hypothetical protein